jgi:hypothetical protein
VIEIRQYDLAAAVASTPQANAPDLAETAARFGVGLDELLTAMNRAETVLLDDIGLTVRAPIIPHPVPPPELLARLSAMYGDSPAAQGAAYRTGEAMERRRQGWTRQGARDEWQRRMLAGIEGAAR